MYLITYNFLQTIASVMGKPKINKSCPPWPHVEKKTQSSLYFSVHNLKKYHGCYALCNDCFFIFRRLLGTNCKEICNKQKRFLAISNKKLHFFQSRTFWCYLILSFQDLFSVGKYVFSFFRTFFFYKLNPNQDFSESTYFCIVVVGLGFLWVFIYILDQEDENKLQGHLLTADINICFTSFLIVK